MYGQHKKAKPTHLPKKRNPNTKYHTAMWAVSYLPPPTPPCHPLVPNLTKPPPLNLKSLSVSAKSQSAGQDLGGLGRSILTKLKSNPKPTTTPILSKQKQRQNQEGKQMISGSEVLFALQKAAAKKSREIGKKKKKANVSSSSSSSSSSYVGSHREEEGVDEDGKVRPLCVKSEWGDRLDELEKRFQELSSKVI